MLERASAILSEFGREDHYKGSISIDYASEALTILNHPNFDEKANETIGQGDADISSGLNGHTLHQYCCYLLERARENYVNERMGEHTKVAEAVKKFLDKA